MQKFVQWPPTYQHNRRIVRQFPFVGRPGGDVFAITTKDVAQAKFAVGELLVDLEEGIVIPNFKLQPLSYAT